jgi:hypothetical protein
VQVTELDEDVDKEEDEKFPMSLLEQNGQYLLKIISKNETVDDR